MPRTRRNSAAPKAVEPVIEPAETEEQVDLEEQEEIEEEVEYEEVEEEVEEEDEEEVEEEEVEEEDEENVTTNGANADTKAASDDCMQDDEQDERDEDEIKEHTELLALPPHGSEVYAGGIPLDASEEDLKSFFCESVGEVTEVRIMKGKNSSEHKGYAFVTFRTKELASKAIEDLNITQSKWKRIKCSSSQTKNRLFIGNVPRNWVEDDLKKAVTKVGPGVITVNLMKDPHNSSRNRGFAFVEYYNHACAEYSRKRMSRPKFKLDSNVPTVSWAGTKNGDSSSNSQIKAVYVKNLPKDITQEQLRELFEYHGEITKVVLPPAKSGQEKRYGFVHFADRSTALKALKNTERYELNGDVLECSLAQPPADKKVFAPPSNSQKGALLPNYAPRGYGVMGAGYGPLTPGFAPMMYGREQLPAGMAMVPMMLPDGRLGYVMQQPGAHVAAPHRGGGGGYGGSASSGGRKGNDSSRGRRFNPY